MNSMRLVNSRMQCLVLLLLFAASSCARQSETSILSAPQDVSSSGLVLELDPPVWTKYSSQVVRIELATPYQPDIRIQSFGIIVNNGKSFSPRVTLVDSGGRDYPLRLLGFYGHSLQYDNDKLPRGVDFRKLIIQSDQRIRLRGVSWITCEPEDSKTGTC